MVLNSSFSHSSKAQTRAQTPKCGNLKARENLGTVVIHYYQSTGR